MTWCRIELFGGLKVQINGMLLTRFRTRKTASLLAYLAYYLDRMHPREALVEMFWGDSKPEQGRNSLSKAISSLRQQFSFSGDSTDSILYADRFYVMLRSEFVSTDVADFDAHLKLARSARSIPEKISHLTEAVKFYRGDLLPEFYDDWIEPERLRRSEQFENAIQELVDFHQQTGNIAQALHFARLALSVEPLSEIVCERLMKLLLAIRQPAEALREYQALLQRLKERLGSDALVPSTTLRSIAEQAEQMLRQMPQERKDFSSEPTNLVFCPNLPICLGTVTLLAIAWQPRNNGQTLSKDLKLLVERYGGQTVKVDGRNFFSAFSCARRAVECAFTIQTQFQNHFVRCLVDTVDLMNEDGLTDALEQAKNLLVNVVKDGQVICSETTASLLKRSDGFFARLQKVKSLRDLNSVRSFFAVNLDLPDEARTTNLPPLTTRFFGRSEELEQLSQWILSERTQLVTLVGLGGSGKTRLALEFGHKAVNDYRGAIFFVPLQEVKEMSSVGEVLAKALGLRISPEQEPIKAVVQALSKRRCLLIWDGFEQVLPEGLEILRNVMHQLPTAQNLVTSRCPLRLPQERILTVAPLPFPQNLDNEGEGGLLDLNAISQFPSVQMFVDRARAIRPDFNLTERNAGKIAEICMRLEGLPLAIELTVSWLAYLSLSQISERLKQRLDFLQTFRRNIPQRHKSMRVVLSMTWELLPEDLKHALACLSVFRGGATIDSMRAVTEKANIDEVISQLQSWGLVFTIGQRNDEQRFSLLDTVREFVLEKIEPDAFKSLRYKHSEFFLSLAEKFADSKGRSGEEWANWLRRMEAERNNLRATLEWTTENEPQNALQLMRYLTMFWHTQGTFQEAFRWAYRILTCIPTESTALKAKAFVLTGHWAVRTGNYGLAEKLCESALALCEQSHDELCQADAHLLFAEISYLKGDYPVAVRHAKTSLEKYRATGELKGEAQTYYLLGSVAFRQGDIKNAKRFYERSIKIWKSLGEQMQVEQVRKGLSDIAWRQGDFKRANELCEKVLGFWSVVNPMRATGILSDWGLIALSMGNYEQAQKHYELALKIRGELGDQLGVGAALNGLASVAWRKGKLDEAQKLLSEALSIFQSIGNRWCIALTLTDLGNLALLRGDNELAQTLLSQSLQTWCNLGDQWGIANALRKLALSEARCGNYREALSRLQESLEICWDLKDKLGIVEAVEALAETLTKIGNHTLALRALSFTEKMRRRLRSPLPEIKRKQLSNLLNELRGKLGRSRFEVEWRRGQRTNLRYLLRKLSLTFTRPSLAPKQKIQNANSLPLCDQLRTLKGSQRRT
ncbi:MAG: tetratricopeptide repeat protein, partial [Armatimonadetes bacterium]|nr:tetratricopeptide repeat protein [Armatimonadota bacterium]